VVRLKIVKIHFDCVFGISLQPTIFIKEFSEV